MLEQHPKLAELLLLLYLGLLTLGQLTRWQIFSSGAVLGIDIVSILVSFLVLPCIFKQVRLWWQRQNKQQQTLISLMLLWVAIGWGVAMFGGYEVLPTLLRFLRLVLNLMVIWYLLFHVPRKTATWWITTQIGIGVWLGLIQYVFLPDSRWLAVLGWDDHYFRLIGTFLDPNFMGLWLVLALLWLLHLKSQTALKWIGLATVATALGVTFSRSAFLAGAAALVMLVWSSKSNKRQMLLLQTAFIGLVMIGSIVLAPKPGGEGIKLTRTASITARVDASSNWLPNKPHQWLLGSGLGVVEEYSVSSVPNHSQMPDNLFLLCVSGIGIGGIVLVLALLYSYRLIFIQLPSWVIACWIAVLTHAQFNNSLFEPVIWSWLWVLTLSGTLTRKTVVSKL